MAINKDGTILITSLWILIILSILAVGIGFRVSIEARLSKHNMDRIKGFYLAKAGIVKAREILSKDNNDYDSIRECGIVLPQDKRLEEVFFEKLDDGAFTVSYDEEGKKYYGMMDEERKICINMAPPEVMVNLLGKGNEAVAASIINWRGAARLPDGAWDDDYKSLKAPYECKHAGFSCIEELMLVKGMTPKLFDSIKDYVTVYGDTEGRVNVNTATKRVMLALGLSEPVAALIIEVRNGADKIAGTKDDGIFTGDIASRISIPIDSPDRTVLGNRFTTVSNYFRIEDRGVVDKSKISSRIVCVVKRGEKKLKSYREY